MLYIVVFFNIFFIIADLTISFNHPISAITNNSLSMKIRSDEKIDYDFFINFSSPLVIESISFE